MTQIQVKPTADELIKEIAETYVNERGWADVMELLPILYVEASKSLGIQLYNTLCEEVGKLALKDKHCFFDGEKLIHIIPEGYRNYRCPECWQVWQESEVGQQ